jgi:AbrB family looped-hinge helix DNA binding protein
MVLAKVRTVAKVTSKLQVTIPKAIADAHGIKPGAEIDFESAGDVIRVRPRRRRVAAQSASRAVAMFDQATRRQAERDSQLRRDHPAVFESTERGWSREELYDRGVPR